MEDMPLIFDKVDIDTTVKPGYDIYLMDDVPRTPPPGLVIHFKSKFFTMYKKFRYLDQ